MRRIKFKNKKRKREELRRSLFQKHLFLIGFENTTQLTINLKLQFTILLTLVLVIPSVLIFLVLLIDITIISSSLAPAIFSVCFYFYFNLFILFILFVYLNLFVYYLNYFKVLFFQLFIYLF